MDNKKLKVLEPPLLEHVDRITDELESFLHESGLSGAVRGGVWVLEQYVSGAVMYRPYNDPSEESIDVHFTVDLKEEVKEAKINIGLMWSHGPIIKSYIEDEITAYSTLDELATQLDQLFDNLKESFLEDMKKEMQIERAPVYRNF